MTSAQVVINNIDAVIAEPAARALMQQMVSDCPELLSSIEAAFKSRFLPPAHAAAATSQAALLEAFSTARPLRGSANMPVYMVSVLVGTGVCSRACCSRSFVPFYKILCACCMAAGAFDRWARDGMTLVPAAGATAGQRVSSSGEVVDADLSLLQSFAATPPGGNAGMAGWPPAATSLSLPPLPEEPHAAGTGFGAAVDSVGASLRPTAGTLAVAMHGRSDRPAMGQDAICRQAHASMHAVEDASMSAAPRCGPRICPCGDARAFGRGARHWRTGLRRCGESGCGGCRAFKTHEDEQTERLAGKLAGHVRKRLQQIRRLEVQAAAGAHLDAQQRAKMQQRRGYEAARVALDRGDEAACAPTPPPRAPAPCSVAQRSQALSSCQ